MRSQLASSAPPWQAVLLHGKQCSSTVSAPALVAINSYSNSSSKESDTFSWTLGHCTHMLYRCTCKQNFHTHKIKRKSQEYWSIKRDHFFKNSNILVFIKIPRRRDWRGGLVVRCYLLQRIHISSQHPHRRSKS